MYSISSTAPCQSWPGFQDSRVWSAGMAGGLLVAGCWGSCAVYDGRAGVQVTAITMPRMVTPIATAPMVIATTCVMRSWTWVIA